MIFVNFGRQYAFTVLLPLEHYTHIIGAFLKQAAHYTFLLFSVVSRLACTFPFWATDN